MEIKTNVVCKRYKAEFEYRGIPVYEVVYNSESIEAAKLKALEIAQLRGWTYKCTRYAPEVED
jgi:hypothetical protein